MVEITCPNCNFSKTISAENIPAGLRIVKCPKCNTRFDYFTKNIIPDSVTQNRPPVGRKNRIRSPWEDRGKVGNLRGILDTFKSVLFSPKQFFSRISYSNGIIEPLAYGLLLGSIGSMFGFFWQFLIQSMGMQSQGGILPIHISQDPTSPILIITVPFICVLVMFVTGITAHLCLMAVGGGQNGFEGDS